MENSLNLAYAEVSKILSYMDEKEIEKIPLNLRNKIENEKIKDYEPVINPKIPLAQQNLQRNTLIILAILNLNYWCESEEEKKELVRIYTEQDKKIEEELREKYNPDNIFKKKIQKEELVKEELVKEESVALVKYKNENIFSKIITKITNFFKNK